MSRTQALEELFEQWRPRSIQAAKALDFPCQDRFIPDGIVDEGEYERGSKILFVLIESHSPHTREECKKEEFDPLECAEQCCFFWHADSINGTGKNKIECMDLRSRRYFTRSLLMQRIAEGGKPGDFSYNEKGELLADDFSPLKQAAFMNINKAGGRGTSTEWEKLLAYLHGNASYIHREVEIIDPKLIICCGNVVREALGFVLREDHLGKCVKMWHPRQAQIKTKEYGGKVTDKVYAEEFHKRFTQWKGQPPCV